MWQKAAALCQAIDSAQSVVNGNKRLAWLVTKVFLAMNSQRLTATADSGKRFLLDQLAGHASFENIADWVRSHCHDAPPPQRARNRAATMSERPSLVQLFAWLASAGGTLMAC